MDRVDGPEGRRNAGEAADSFFHPSRPPGSGYLVHRKSLISCLKSAHGAGKMPIHLGNPGLHGRPQSSGLRHGSANNQSPSNRRTVMVRTARTETGKAVDVARAAADRIMPAKQAM